MREQDFERLFRVKKDFTDSAGRKISSGMTIRIDNKDEACALLSLGFVVPGGKRTMDTVTQISWGGR